MMDRKEILFKETFGRNCWR